MGRRLIAGAVLAGAVAGQSSAQLVYEQPFDDASAAADFVCTDPDAWSLDRGSFWQHSGSDYRPTHRSPYNIALLATQRFGSFVLEADVMQTGREYGHRDLCVFFAFESPDRYCYTHLSTNADQNAHQVFVVDDAPRTPITTRRTDGVDWGWNSWKRLRVERDLDAGSVRVLLDGVEVAFSDGVPLGAGYIGFGSFDDEMRVDNIRLWSGQAERRECEAFDVAHDEVRDREVRLVEGDGKVDVFFGDEFFTSYVYAGTPKPYLAPVQGPGGVRMTRAYPMEEVEGEARDHPHHTGLWWAHGSINGVDLWHKGARLELLREPSLSPASIGAAFSLVTNDGPTGIEIAQVLRFEETLSGDRAISFLTALTAPPDGALRFGDTKEGTMAIRTHPALRLKPSPGAGVTDVTGRAINSEGVEGAAVWGKRAAWVDYHGTIDGLPVGVAIFDHPRNPRYPTWWHARDYGLIAANPFGTSAFEGGESGRGLMELDRGRNVTFRYQFLFHRFSTTDARVADAFDAWERHGMTPRGADDR